MLKKLSIILSLLLFQIGFSHTDKVFEKTYGNVNITMITGAYYEEINKTFIIGIYAEKLSKKLLYKGEINLLFFHQYVKGVEEINYHLEWNKPTKIEKNDKIRILKDIKITLKDSIFDIPNTLKLIEYSIKNKEKLSDLSIENIKQIIASPISEDIKDVLEEKVYRPDVVEELYSNNRFSYYCKNNKYYIVYYDNKVETNFLSLDTIFQFSPLGYWEIVIFPTNNTFYVINLKEKGDLIKNLIQNIGTYNYPYDLFFFNQNKIFFKFSDLDSAFQDRILIYYLNKQIFIQDIDKIVEKCIGKNS